MLRELKFVQGAVAKKDLLPAMTHFRIEGGTVRAYNGVLALSSPLPFDIDCCPKAEPLVKAIASCHETVTLSMTPGGKLRIQSGKFRAFVPTLDGDTMHVEPAGEQIDFNGEAFLAACQILYPFIGNDASRPWTNGILLKDKSAFATNNVCLVEYWMGTDTPFVVNIPRAAIKEVLRVGEAPTHCQLEASSITFHYTDGRWIRSQLLETTWPDLTKILDKPHGAAPLPAELFEGLDVLRSSADGASRVYFKDGMLRTSLDDEEGADFRVDGLAFEGCYPMAMLGLLRDVVTHADFTLYPDPCLFFGDRLRGAIIGMRM
jgi:DNA polymerase III sliding clamp (beta) subunit (PCNA family)